MGNCLVGNCLVSNCHGIEPRHGISSYVTLTNSIDSDQTTLKRSLNRAFATCINQSVDMEADLSLHFQNCRIVGNHVSWLNFRIYVPNIDFLGAR